jgi:hypothetical protein
VEPTINGPTGDQPGLQRLAEAHDGWGLSHSLVTRSINAMQLLSALLLALLVLVFLDSYVHVILNLQSNQVSSYRLQVDLILNLSVLLMCIKSLKVTCDSRTYIFVLNSVSVTSGKERV